MDLDEYRNASYAVKQDLEFEWGMKMGNYLIYRDYFNGKDGSSFKFGRSTRENASFAKMIFGIPTHIIYHEIYEPNITYKDFEELYLEAYNMLLTKLKNTLNFEQLINPTNSTEADIYRAVTIDLDDESENSIEQIAPKEKELPTGLHIDIIRNEYNTYRHLLLSNSIVEY